MPEASINVSFAPEILKNSGNKLVKLLYYCPASCGGIADYAHEQANALCDEGAEVTLLCTPKFQTGRGEKYRVAPVLEEPRPGRASRNRLLRGLRIARTILINSFRLADFIEKNGFKYVLFGTYTEYLAPLWAWRFRMLAQKGVVFGAIVHDPVRDFVVGPRWWHRLSIAEGYSFLKEAFVHDPIDLATVRPMPQLRITAIPHGPYPCAPSACSRETARRELNLPPAAKVLLAFGHIHPHRKNTDLIIRALTEFPDAYLIVAGEDASKDQNVITAYRDLAVKLGVADRCRWKPGFVSGEEAGKLFLASDVVMLVYKGIFRSASGVLNTAVSYRKPCVASGGPGALKEVIKKYDLGIWVRPDDPDALAAGIRKWLENPPCPQWDKYCKENSWETNARLITKCLFEV